VLEAWSETVIAAILARPVFPLPAAVELDEDECENDPPDPRDEIGLEKGAVLLACTPEDVDAVEFVAGE
jgi:hypothetical protein